jgi:hypothetical protein
MNTHESLKAHSPALGLTKAFPALKRGAHFPHL